MSKLGRCGEDGTRILAYVGPQDVRYPVLMLGAAKAGYTVRLFVVHLLLSMIWSDLIPRVAFASVVCFERHKKSRLRV